MLLQSVRVVRYYQYRELHYYLSKKTMRYTEIKRALIEAEIIDEVSMSPSSLEKFANSPEAEGMLLGIEFELCVPNASSGDDEPEWEYDWDANESVVDIDELINFFRMGEFSNMSRSDADRLRSQLYDEYLEWQYEAAQNYVDENSDEVIKKTRENLQDDARDASNDHYDEFVADAKKELGTLLPDDDAAIEERVRELTLAWMDRWIDEQIEEADSREYERAREYAEEELRDEYRDTYASQTDWLESIGVDDMQDAHRRWDLDWPHMYDANYSEGGDQDVDQVAEDFSDYTGFPARGYSNYHSGSRSEQQRQGYFIIEPDGSIDADQGDAGLEFISPAMPLKDGLEMMKKVKDWANAAGCYTNKSTGLHMNISVPNMTIENLDYVKLALFLGDEHVLKEFGRQYNSFCKSAMKIVKEKIEQNPENATALLSKMKEHLGAAASKLVHSGVTQKYTSINTKDKYVEFRGPGGDYLDEDLTKLTGTALRLAQALRIATDDNAYKQEYAKKLYKLVSPEGDWTDPNNSVSLFSRYAMGEIKKDELVSNVRQAQVARKEKKGEEQQYWVMNKDGTGGKQMVFAHSATEAIIKGGKQLGMKREDSISKLKAEEKTAPMDITTLSKDEYHKQVNDLPSYALEEFARRIKTLETSELETTLGQVKNRSVPVRGGDLTDTNYEFLQAIIEHELARREGEIVDTNATRWKVNSLSGSSVYVDADSPRQAKLKAVELFAREHGLAVDANDLEAIATTQDAGAVHAIPQQWRSWVDTLPNRGTATINDFRRDIQNGQHNNSLTSQAQRDAVIRAIDDELRRRQDAGETGEEQSWIVLDGFNRPVGTVNARTRDEAIRIYGSTNDVDTRNYTATPGAGNTSTGDIFRSLPEGWQQILNNITVLTPENLERYRDGVADVDSSILDDGQKEFIANSLNSELSRRGNDITSGMTTTSREVFDSLPEGTRRWLERVGEHHDLELRQALDHIEAGRGIGAGLYSNQTAFVKTAIETELRRRGDDTTSGLTDTEVFNGLPMGWQGTLNRVGELPDQSLRGYISHIDTVPNNVLSAEQKDFIVQVLNTEIRRRSNNDAVDNSDTTEPAGRSIVYDTLPQHWKDYIANDLSYSADMHLINMLRNLSREDAGSQVNLNDQQLAYIRILLKRQLRANGINPDDETPADLTSPDDETIDDVMGGNSDEETQAEQQWKVGNHTYGREIISAPDRAEAIRLFAYKNGISVDDVTSGPSFVAEPVDQTNESIKQLRKLAGLK